MVGTYNLHGKVSATDFTSLLAADQPLPPLQVGWFISDGGSVNPTTLREFKKDLTDADADWSADDHDIL